MARERGILCAVLAIPSTFTILAPTVLTARDIRRCRTPGAGIHSVQTPGTHHAETPGGDIHGTQIPDGIHHDRTHPVSHYSPHSSCYEPMRSTLSPRL